MPLTIIEGPLTAGRAAGVVTLAEAARAADGVAPLSEQTLLHVRPGSARYDSHAGAVGHDLVLVVDDEVIAYAHLDLPDAGQGATGDSAGGDGSTAPQAASGNPGTGDATGDLSGELVVHPSHRRRGNGSALVSALAAAAGGHAIRLWAHGDLPAAAALARSTGFSRVRSLWQMRRPLADPPLPEPVFPAGVAVRTFEPGRDDEAWLEVNRRAFASHPEQGSWTREDLELREAAPWFDPAGFFLAERHGRVAGFHWTKIHPDGPDGVPEGEVYVVGVDPAAHGGGLGKALTLAGLAYLRARGLGHVMLYVDEENTAAARLYEALGFTLWNTDVMYRRAAA